MGITALTTGHYFEEAEKVTAVKHPVVLRAANTQELFLFHPPFLSAKTIE